MDPKIIGAILLLLCCCCISSIGGAFAYNSSKAKEEEEPVANYPPAPANFAASNMVSSSSNDSDSEYDPNYVPLSKVSSERPTSFTEINAYQTQKNEYRSVGWLNRHNINCKEHALNSVQVNFPSDDSAQYNYTCIDGPLDNENAIEKSTAQSNAFSYTNDTLFNQDLDCGKNGVLSRMQLSWDGGPKFNYRYACTPVTGGNKCVKRSTKRKDNTGYNIKNLEAHDVVCQKDEAISRMRLIDDGQTTHYDYTCCKV